MMDPNKIYMDRLLSRKNGGYRPDTFKSSKMK